MSIAGDALLELDAASGKRLLKKLILDANPALFEKNTGSFEKMNILRRWVSSNIPVGQITQIQEYSILHNLTDCLVGKGAVLCGGYSEILGYVYGIFGLNAVVYNYGIPGVYTHVVTLVSEGMLEPYVQDATCNATYVHPDGAPMLFGAMCELLKAHRESDIVRVVDNGERRHAWKDNFSVAEEISFRLEDVAEFVRREDWKVSNRIATAPAAGDWLSRHSLPRMSEYIFLSRLGVTFPRGRVTCPDNIVAFVKNNTLPHQENA